MIELHLERWTGTGLEELEIDPGSISVGEIVVGMSGDRSSLLTLSGERGTSLVIGASGGKYAVTALLGEDCFLDLIGEVGARGKEYFILGGQGIDIPRINLTNCGAAIEAAIDFCRPEKIVISGHWERQGAIRDY